jgi:hypothetical protein
MLIEMKHHDRVGFQAESQPVPCCLSYSMGVSGRISTDTESCKTNETSQHDKKSIEDGRLDRKQTSEEALRQKNGDSTCVMLDPRRWKESG